MVLECRGHQSIGAKTMNKDNERVVWGCFKYKADPNLVYDEVSTLGESCKPQEVVDLAKNPNTELHKCFDWNDEIAANKWRLHTARNILLSLKVESALPLSTICSLLTAAGAFIGVGARRGEGYGRYHIEDIQAR